MDAARLGVLAPYVVVLAHVLAGRRATLRVSVADTPRFHALHPSPIQTARTPAPVAKIRAEISQLIFGCRLMIDGYMQRIKSRAL